MRMSKVLIKSLFYGVCHHLSFIGIRYSLIVRNLAVVVYSTAESKENHDVGEEKMALLETKEVDYYYQDGDQRRYILKETSVAFEKASFMPF